MTKVFSQTGTVLHLPYRVQNIPILKYPEQFVIGRDFVKVGPLLIGKEQVRFPNGVQHRGVQVQRIIWVFSIGESGVVPLLAEEDIYMVVLQTQRITHITHRDTEEA